jgi:hypothetical protein
VLRPFRDPTPQRYCSWTLRSNNSKLREKGKKDEGRRLREFVDAAYK